MKKILIFEDSLQLWSVIGPLQVVTLTDGDAALLAQQANHVSLQQFSKVRVQNLSDIIEKSEAFEAMHGICPDTGQPLYPTHSYDPPDVIVEESVDLDYTGKL